MSTRTQPDSGGVVIRLDQRVFYGCLGVLAFVLLVSIVFVVGLQLGRRGQPATIASQPAQIFQQPGIQVQPGVTQFQPVPAGQPAPFNQPAVRQPHALS